MRLSKKHLKISLGLLLIIFLLAGCSMQGSLLLNITPNPIEFTYDKQSVDTTFKITTEGFGKITIDEISLLVVDESEKEILNKVIEVNETIDFSLPGVSHKEEFTFDLKDFYDGEINESVYNDELKGKEFSLKIKITGSETTTKEVPIVFN